MNDRLNDDDRMYFGKYNGTRLREIPDSYWRWFLKQEWCDEHPGLVEYANVVVEDD